MSVEFAKTFPFPKEAIMPVILRRVNSFPHPEWYNQTDFISLVRIQTSDALRGLQESGWKVLEWEQEFHGKYLKYCPDCNSHLPEEKITHNSQEKGVDYNGKYVPGEIDQLCTPCGESRIKKENSKWIEIVHGVEKVLGPISRHVTTLIKDKNEP